MNNALVGPNGYGVLSATVVNTGIDLLAGAAIGLAHLSHVGEKSGAAWGAGNYLEAVGHFGDDAATTVGTALGVAPGAAAVANKLQAALSKIPRSFWYRCRRGSIGTSPHGITFAPKNLQHEFGHAADFGVTGNWNKANAALFQQAIEGHIANAPVQISGTFRGSIPVTHYFDPATNLWAAVDNLGMFRAGWKLSPAQAKHLLTHGNVQ